MDANIDIAHYLPHRKPMLMVDVIISMDAENVETTFTITPNNLFVQSNGFFCEAGLVENAAQTCSAIVAKGFYVDENNQDRNDVAVLGFISALKNLKIYNLPKIGSVIKTTARLVSNFAADDYSLCTMSCKTVADGKILLEGEINLFIQQRPTETVVKSTS